MTTSRSGATGPLSRATTSKGSIGTVCSPTRASGSTSPGSPGRSSPSAAAAARCPRGWRSAACPTVTPPRRPTPPTRTSGVPRTRPRISSKKTATIDDAPAMRDVRVVVVDAPAAAPIVSPTIPSPAKPSEESNTETQSPIDSRTIPKKSRIRIPAGENSQRIAVHEPGIVLRHVYYVGRCRLNDDRFVVIAYGLLGGSLQVPGPPRPLTHGLNHLIQGLPLVDRGVAEFRCPREILVHIGEHRGELG